jgi:hypothetical protein
MTSIIVLSAIGLKYVILISRMKFFYRQNTPYPLKSLSLEPATQLCFGLTYIWTNRPSYRPGPTEKTTIGNRRFNFLVQIIGLNLDNGLS